MYLLIDQGNSRCKYVLTKSVEPFKEETAGAWNSKASSADELKKHLEQFVSVGVKAVIISSVASLEAKKAFKQACEKTLAITPFFAESTSSYTAKGISPTGNCAQLSRTLVNTYAKPQALGVDRWLAMIAVFERCVTDFIVIDAGTAITADWVNAQGVHQGGHIVAGKKLLQQSLLGETGGIAWSASHDNQAEGDLFGQNTSAAVSLGADVMVEGYCRQLVRQIISAYKDADNRNDLEIWLTGGDGAEVLQWIEQELQLLNKPFKVTLEPKLVFLGLNHWFSVNK